MGTLTIDFAADQYLWLPQYLISSFLGQAPNSHAADARFYKADGQQPVTLTSNDGTQAQDDKALKHLLSQRTRASPNDTFVVREWAARTPEFARADFATLRRLGDDLDRHLTLRTYIDGYQLSIADISLWAAIRANKVSKAVLQQLGPSISRWYVFVEQSNFWLMEALQTVNSLLAQSKAAQSSAGASYELGDEFKGPQVTRFPPEPSGYLHIGHGKAALLNDYFAHRVPGGSLLCRFDDTNPSKESQEFQDSILEDLRLMDIVPDKVSYSSDYFDKMYELAIKLIKDGKAFADDSELGKGDQDRKNRLPSVRRDLSIEDTLARFDDMKSGSVAGQRWCLRARIAYDSPNGTLRDPVIYRCNMTPHHRTGGAWKIYPTYDFCAPILDSIEGITLALRTNEYRDRNVQYQWFQDALGLRSVEIWDFSRMNFVRTVLSKRKLTKIVELRKVWGWDDPRMPTIRGILRRGMTVEALREYILSQGPSKNILNLEWGAIWSLNKKKLDPIVARHTAIDSNATVHCTVTGVSEESSAERPKHPKNADLGTKDVWYGGNILMEQIDAQTLQPDEEITLMNWGNAFVRNITGGGKEEPVTHVDLELHLEGDVKKTEKKLTWLAAIQTNMVPVSLLSLDYLITKDKLEPQDKLEDFLTPQTEFKVEAFADSNVASLKPGTIVQFERKGYYKLDTATRQPGAPMVFFEIPSGRK